MDSQRGGAYDPSQPWAVTDALAGILARTLLRSAHQNRLDAANLSHVGSAELEHGVSAQRQSSPVKKPAAVSSQFWADESNPATGAHYGTAAGITPDSAPVGSAPDPSSHRLSSHASSGAQGSPESGGSSSHSHSLSQNYDQNRGHDAAIGGGKDVEDGLGSTPGLNNGVSPMMIDPNLAAWQGEGHGHEHEHESFLQQYSDMDGDYAAVPQTMIDPNLALMHDDDEFRHERNPDEGHLDDFEGAHHLSIPPAQGGPKRRLNSPYFADESPAKSAQQPSPRRRQRGTVSCIPFPRLTAPYFGLIQEQLAHDPFWLLIVVTFLIRTTGKAAIPVFWQVMQRFPSPAMLGDGTNVPELTGMIRHLGLASTRVAAIRRYANGWMKQPPRAGLRYRVRDYAQRDAAVVPDIDPVSAGHLSPGVAANFANFATFATFATFAGGFPSPSGVMRGDDSSGAMARPASDADLEAWEIGHLTQGQYAIDSWRIFCRDALLGKALDWRGSGREAEFQPEWMRVVPQDKELRAYLRWMWMREGWQWDPLTGERRVLSEEMRAAVEEGRVAYNDDGELEIIGREAQVEFTSGWPGI